MSNLYNNRIDLYINHLESERVGIIYCLELLFLKSGLVWLEHVILQN